MENALKVILLAGGVVIVAAIMAFAFGLFNTGSDLFNMGTNQLNATLSGLSDADKQVYNGSTVSGKEVILAIQKYAEQDGLYIVVNTLRGGMTIYDSSLGPAADPTGTEAKKNTGNPSDSNALGVVYDASWHVSGFPSTYHTTTKQNGGTTVVTQPTDTSKFTTTFPMSTDPPSGITTPARTDGQYNSLCEKNDATYISPKASFEASIQVDQNNDVRFITFKQK